MWVLLKTVQYQIISETSKLDGLESRDKPHDVFDNIMNPVREKNNVIQYGW